MGKIDVQVLEFSLACMAGIQLQHFNAQNNKILELRTRIAINVSETMCCRSYPNVLY